MRKHPKRVIIRTGDMAAPGKEILYKYNFDEEHLEITELKVHMINHASDKKPSINVIFDEKPNETNSEL